MVGRPSQLLNRAPRARGTGNEWRVVGVTAVVKFVVMGLSGVLGILTSRMIISHYGVDSYAQYGLLSSLPSLLPFADLGVAAAIVNVVASSSHVSRDLEVRQTITSALRILAGSSATIVLVSIALYLVGAWPAILGDGLTAYGPLTATLCLVIFGLSLPLAIGTRVLVGLNKNPAQLMAQAVIAPVILGCVGATIVLGIPAGDFVALFPYLGAAAASTICLVIASRAIRPQMRLAARDAPHVRTRPSVRVMDTAWPMLIQMIALPVAMQTDRILVSHRGGPDVLAEYNLAFQLFGIALQTISASGVALWPIFARFRARGEVRSPAKLSLLFLAFSLALAAVVAFLSPWIAAFVSGGSITLSPAVLVSFCLFVVVQSVKYPLGMYMTDKRGLRFQVLPTVAMVPVTVGLSWYLIGVIGAAGPALATAVAVLLCQIAPMIWWVRRDLRHRSQSASTSTEA